MKKALVIGGSSDIGKEVIKRLIKKKYYIYSSYFQNSKDLSQMKKSSNQIDYLKLNFNSLISIKKFILELKNKTDNLDLIILSANIRVKRKSFLKINSNTLKKILINNINSYIFLFQLLIKKIIKKKYCKIIHISSLTTKNGSWGLCEYSISKAAVDKMLKCLKFEFKKLNVESVFIGPVKTKGYLYTNQIKKNKKTKFLDIIKISRKIIKII